MYLSIQSSEPYMYLTQHDEFGNEFGMTQTDCGTLSAAPLAGSVSEGRPESSVLLDVLFPIDGGAGGLLVPISSVHHDQPSILIATSPYIDVSIAAIASRTTHSDSCFCL